MTDQTIARGVRFNSHLGVDYDEVHVYHYLAVPRDPTLLSVDTHLRNIQNEKRNVLRVFESVLQKASIEESPNPQNRVVNHNTNENYVITTVVRTEERQEPAPKKGLRRITRLAPYNPRAHKKTQKPKKIKTT